MRGRGRGTAALKRLSLTASPELFPTCLISVCLRY